MRARARASTRCGDKRAGRSALSDIACPLRRLKWRWTFCDLNSRLCRARSAFRCGWQRLPRSRSTLLVRLLQACLAAYRRFCLSPFGIPIHDIQIAQRTQCLSGSERSCSALCASAASLARTRVCKSPCSAPPAHCPSVRSPAARRWRPPCSSCVLALRRGHCDRGNQ